MTSKPTPGAANNSSWNDSGFAFAPNTNTMDRETMPSAEAQAARDKANEIMAALRSGDTAKANAMMGKDQTPGRLLPGMRWLKKKLASKDQPKYDGVEVNNDDESINSLAKDDKSRISA